jgi:hypothetical protein
VTRYFNRRYHIHGGRKRPFNLCAFGGRQVMENRKVGVDEIALGREMLFAQLVEHAASRFAILNVRISGSNILGG